MKKKLLPALLLCALGAFAKDGFKPLFNGKNLDGWDGDPNLWSVQDHMIVGSTEGHPLKYNSFLATKKSYANFILRAQAKLRNHNSGIQFRSELIPDLKWAVRGYQADMAENNYWGCIYEEKSLKKRGILENGWDKAQKVVKLTDWNDLELLCDGDHISLKVNGLETADLHDSEKLEGIFALQLHMGPPMQVYFRNIEIKVLKAK